MWSQILGHNRQIEQLKKAVGENRLPNAYLFYGLAGIGKKFVAKAFVSSLFCKKSPDACGVCVPCSKIKNAIHPDVFFLEPKTQKILIEQVRDLQQRLQYYSLEGNRKVAVIDDAEAMTESAANSLLKILEEPPSNTHFILISAFPHRILPTIRSRCQQIAFSPLPTEFVKKYLIDQRNLDEKDAIRLARISQGSIGAISLLEPHFIEEVLDKVSYLLKSANTADIVATAELWSKENDRIPLIFDLLMSFYRDALYHRATGTAGSRANEVICSATSGFKEEQLLNYLSVIAGTRELFETTANKQLLFEQLLFTLTS